VPRRAFLPSSSPRSLFRSRPATPTSSAVVERSVSCSSSPFLFLYSLQFSLPSSSESPPTSATAWARPLARTPLPTCVLLPFVVRSPLTSFPPLDRHCGSLLQAGARQPRRRFPPRSRRVQWLVERDELPTCYCCALVGMLPLPEQPFVVSFFFLTKFAKLTTSPPHSRLHLPDDQRLAHR
jgi:hypothetical protein